MSLEYLLCLNILFNQGCSLSRFLSRWGQCNGTKRILQRFTVTFRTSQNKFSSLDTVYPEPTQLDPLEEKTCSQQCFILCFDHNLSSENWFKDHSKTFTHGHFLGEVWARSEDLHSKQGIQMEQLFHLDLWSTKLIKVISNLLTLQGHLIGEVWAKQGQGDRKFACFLLKKKLLQGHYTTSTKKHFMDKAWLPGHINIMITVSLGIWRYIMYNTCILWKIPAADSATNTKTLEIHGPRA